MEYEDVLTNQPVVIDNGSGVIKGGFAGSELPHSFFNSVVGVPKYVKFMAGSDVDNTQFVGDNAERHRGLLKLTYPIEHGIVKDWVNMEKIWSYMYTNKLKVSSEEHPVLLTEAPYNPRPVTERCAQIFFETFNVPAFLTSIQAVLSLYSSGRTTGVVLDCGDGVCHCVPIYEGFAIPSAIRRIDVGGRDITTFLQLMLRKEGYIFNTSSEMEIVKQIKEKCCYVSINPQKEDKTALMKPIEYLLPDGKVIKIGNERFKASELLFNPELNGIEYKGVQQIVIDSINNTDIDLRASLYKNIVLSGGSTLFKGFGDRMINEIKKLATRDIKIKITAPPERKYSTWIGGSILASLSSFRKMWVSAEDYNEDPYIIHKKSLC